MNTEEPGGEQGEANVFDVFAGPDTEPTETEKGATTSDADASEETPPGTTRDKGPYDFLGDDKPIDDKALDDHQDIKPTDNDQGNGQSVDLRAVIEGQLQKSLGRAVKLPEDVNEDNLAEKLMEMGRNDLHPEALRLQAAIDSGMSPDSYYKSYSRFDEALSLDDRELVRRSISARYGKSEARPDGWDDARVNARLERLSEIDIEDHAFDIRDSIKSQKAQRDLEIAEGPRRQLPDPSTPEFRKDFDEGFDNVFGEVMKEGDLYGVKFSTPEKQQAFSKRMKEVLYPDQRTRQNKFVEALQDPKESLRIAMLWDMVKSGQLQLNASKSSAAATKKLSDMLSSKRSASAAPRAGEAVDFSVFSNPG